jgi:DNA-directed RNA polymerase
MSSVSGVSGANRDKNVVVATTATKDTKDATDIEKYIEKQIEIKLNSLLETLPDKLPKDLTIKPIYNLTIKEIYKKTLQSLIDIITDVVDVYSKKDYVNNNNYMYILLNIFTKDDRKIYVGIMLLVLSFIVYFIDGVSI